MHAFIAFDWQVYDFSVGKANVSVLWLVFCFSSISLTIPNPARSREKGQMKFPLIPKIHPLEEILFLMEHQAKFSQWVLNPMVESCSLDEDFIGHAAYITRHVSPRLMALRTFNRYLPRSCWIGEADSLQLFPSIRLYIYIYIYTHISFILVFSTKQPVSLSLEAIVRYHAKCYDLVILQGKHL